VEAGLAAFAATARTLSRNVFSRAFSNCAGNAPATRLGIRILTFPSVRGILQAVTARPARNAVSNGGQPPRWNEILDESLQPREPYARLLEMLQKLRPAEIRTLDQRMEATLREMGVRSDSQKNAPPVPWVCDLLPHIFTTEEWRIIVSGFRQRLRAWEMFLQDIYGKREILRTGTIPIHAALGSPLYQNAAIGLPLPHDHFLHLCGICLIRDRSGRLMVKDHSMSRAIGIPYMMQNRRALARVIPELFREMPVQSLAEVPLAVVEKVRGLAIGGESEPSVVDTRMRATRRTVSSRGAWAFHSCRAAICWCSTITFISRRSMACGGWMLSITAFPMHG
jgi:Circularly permuted ATP-grasp type 2